MVCSIVENSIAVEAVSWPAISAAQPPVSATAIRASAVPSDKADDGTALEQAHHTELARVRHAAFQEGLNRGREESALQIKESGDRLARVIQDLHGLKPKLRSEAEADTVKLSLAIARRILHRELQMDPDSLGGLVHAALQQLEGRQISTVRTCAAAAEGVKACLAQSGAAAAIRVLADPEMRMGDITFETSLGTLDTSIETQLKEIERGFADRLGLK